MSHYPIYFFSCILSQAGCIPRNLFRGDVRNLKLVFRAKKKKYLTNQLLNEIMAGLSNRISYHVHRMVSLETLNQELPKRLPIRDSHYSWSLRVGAPRKRILQRIAPCELREDFIAAALSYYSWNDWQPPINNECSVLCFSFLKQQLVFRLLENNFQGQT